MVHVAPVRAQYRHGPGTDRGQTLLSDRVGHHGLLRTPLYILGSMHYDLT
jgi:hypothetical protein